MAKNRLSTFQLPTFGNHRINCWQLNCHSPGVMFSKILHFEDQARLCGGRNIVHQRIWVLICSADFPNGLLIPLLPYNSDLWPGKSPGELFTHIFCGGNHDLQFSGWAKKVTWTWAEHVTCVT